MPDVACRQPRGDMRQLVDGIASTHIDIETSRHRRGSSGSTWPCRDRGIAPRCSNYAQIDIMKIPVPRQNIFRRGARRPRRHHRLPVRKSAVEPDNVCSTTSRGGGRLRAGTGVCLATAVGCSRVCASRAVSEEAARASGGLVLLHAGIRFIEKTANARASRRCGISSPKR